VIPAFRDTRTAAAAERVSRQDGPVCARFPSP
jgi:hypothetical protein